MLSTTSSEESRMSACRACYCKTTASRRDEAHDVDLALVQVGLMQKRVQP